MPIFKYKARSVSGGVKEAETEAANSKKVFEDLRSQGLQLIEINEVSKSKKVNDNLVIKQSDVILFTEELGELLDAGLPLEPALASMEKRGDANKIKFIAKNLRKSISDGVPAHVALQKISLKFDQLYRSLVAAGEASGSLSSIIVQHAIYLKKQAELKAKLIGALIYPFALVITCIGVGLIFIFRLMPQMSGLLKSISKGDLPLGIRVSEWIRDTIDQHWLMMVIALIIGIIGIKLFFSHESQLERIDRWKFRIPFGGRIFEYGFYVRWLLTLSNLIKNGVPLDKSLALTEKTVENRYCRKKLSQVLDKVNDGMKLTSSMKSAGIFPDNMIDLIAVSDETGNLSDALERASGYFSKQLEKKIKFFLSLFSVVILASMALLVGGLAYTLLQAIYGSMENMNR